MHTHRTLCGRCTAACLLLYLSLTTGCYYSMQMVVCEGARGRVTVVPAESAWSPDGVPIGGASVAYTPFGGSDGDAGTRELRWVLRSRSDGTIGPLCIPGGAFWRAPLTLSCSRDGYQTVTARVDVSEFGIRYPGRTLLITMAPTDGQPAQDEGTNKRDTPAHGLTVGASRLKVPVGCAVEEGAEPVEGGWADRVILEPDGVAIEMVLIPAGEFLMGSPKGQKGSRRCERPQTVVRIEHPFYMAEYETTQTQYGMVEFRDPSKFQGPARPVGGTDWYDARSFCRTLSRRTGALVRLPTEAEWEYACRAGSTTAYSFGDARGLDAYAWYAGNSDWHIHNVGLKKPNPWGLYDVHGNVAEWCLSRRWDYPYQAQDGRNEPGGWSQEYAVRGGSFRDLPAGSRSAARYDPFDVLRLWEGIGFRVVIELPRE